MWVWLFKIMLSLQYIFTTSIQNKLFNSFLWWLLNKTAIQSNTRNLSFLITQNKCDVKVHNITSLNTMYSGDESEQHWMYIIYALILSHSPTDITLLYKSKGQKDYIKGTQEHISESIEISVMQSVIEWLVSHNLFNRNTI